MEIPNYTSTRMHYQHKALVDLIDGVTDEQIRRQPEPGKWSVFEHIVHLQTYQHRFIERVRRILAEQNPAFERYVADSDPLFQENCSRSSREILQDMISTRKEMAKEILKFPPSDLHKKATHPFYGEMNLVEWVNFFLLHESHHLYSIFRLIAGLKKENIGN